MALAIVQSAAGAYGLHGNGYTDVTNIQMASAPTHNNLLVACGDINLSNGVPGANTGWTLAQKGTNSSGYITAVYYKYAGVSESTTQTPDNAGRNGGGFVIWEISGVSGTWATDTVAITLTNPSSASTSFTSSSVSTSNSNELVLTFIAGDNGIGYATPAAITAAGSGTITSDQHIGANGGIDGTSIVGGHYLLIASSGTATSESTSSSNSSAWVTAKVELQSSGASNTETATVHLSLTGVSFATVAAPTVTGAVTLALSKVSFVAADSALTTINTTLALGHVNFNASAKDITEDEYVTLQLSGVTMLIYNYDTTVIPQSFLVTPFG